jgi:hypothetical protein
MVAQTFDRHLEQRITDVVLKFRKLRAATTKMSAKSSLDALLESLQELDYAAVSAKMIGEQK